MSFLEKAGKVGKVVGKGVLDSMESKSKSYSRDKRMPEELREKYEELGEAAGKMKKTYFDDED